MHTHIRFSSLAASDGHPKPKLATLLAVVMITGAALWTPTVSAAHTRTSVPAAVGSGTAVADETGPGNEIAVADETSQPTAGAASPLYCPHGKVRTVSQLSDGQRVTQFYGNIALDLRRDTG